MTAAVAIAALALGAGVGGLLLHRLDKRIGPSYAEWRAVEPMGGEWSSFIRLGVMALLLLVIAGTFLPGWLRAAIPGLLLGFCAPFFVEGLRRKAETGD